MKKITRKQKAFCVNSTVQSLDFCNDTVSILIKILLLLIGRRDIQKGLGHDPREDAEAAMQLLLLKLKKGQLGKEGGWLTERLSEVHNFLV